MKAGMHENLFLDLGLSTIGTNVDPVFTRTVCLTVPLVAPLWLNADATANVPGRSRVTPFRLLIGSIDE